MLKEILKEIHIKSFAGQLTAVDVFHSINKAPIFSDEQLILGIEASWYVESLRLNGKLFESDLNLPDLNLTSALSFLGISTYV